MVRMLGVGVFSVFRESRGDGFDRGFFVVC